MKTISFDPDSRQRFVALGHVCYEIEQIAALVAKYRLITRPERLDDNTQLEMLLLHLRVLLDFFEDENRRTKPRVNPPEEDDDVLAKDFGFGVADIDIPKHYRERLNKDLAHLTYSRAGETWVIDDIARPLLSRCQKFAAHVLRSQTGSLQLDAESRARWAELNQELIALIALPRSAAARATGAAGPRSGFR